MRRKTYEFFDGPLGFGQNVWVRDTERVWILAARTTGLGITTPDGSFLEVVLADGSLCWEQIQGGSCPPGSYDQGDLVAGEIVVGMAEALARAKGAKAVGP